MEYFIEDFLDDQHFVSNFKIGQMNSKARQQYYNSLKLCSTSHIPIIQTQDQEHYLSL